MRSYTFPIQLIRQDDGRYFVTCPALPGCHSQGDSIDEAKANIRQAIELVLEDLQAHDEPIPDGGQALIATVTVEA